MNITVYLNDTNCNVVVVLDIYKVALMQNSTQ